MADNLDVARAAVRLALTASRDEEQALRQELATTGIAAAAVDLGGELPAALPKLVERILVASRREGVIRAVHPHDGAVAGAAREALGQVAARAVGFGIGGKAAVARSAEHLAVAVFASVGLLYLDDVALGLAHRVVPA